MTAAASSGVVVPVGEAGSPRGREMHIALFLRSLGGGGVQRSMLSLAGALAMRGHRIEVVACRAEGPFRDRLPPGTELVALREGATLRGRLAALRADPGGAPQMLLPVLAPLVVSWQLHYLPDLARYLERRRPDVIVTGGTYLALVALWARRLAGAGTAVLVTERGNLAHHLFYGSKRRKWRYRFVLPLLRRTLPWADGFVSVSDGVADNLSALAGIPRSRITTIYNPVVTPELATLALAPVGHPWLAPGGPPVVLAVGRLVDQKDFPTLLRAFARVRAEREARLIILGEGKRRDSLASLAQALGIAASVAMPGFVENPFAFMARAAVFVLSSAYEGLPGVLIQAMACGCPVVSTACPDGPAEVLLGGAHGPLVPVGDAGAMASAIMQVLDAPPDPGSLRKRADDFSSDRSTDAYLRVLGDLLARP